MTRLERGTACWARCPPPEARPVPGNTKGGCPFVPERQSGPPCNPPNAAPDALRSVGRARRLARARGKILALPPHPVPRRKGRSAEHTSELQSLMRIPYAVFCLKKKTNCTP